MNISYKNGSITLQSGDASCTLTDTGITIDGYVMDFPGEYERRGVFVEIREATNLLFILTLENQTLIYLPNNTTAESLEALRDVNNKDMVICPANESLWKVVESWEPCVMVAFGAESQDFLTKLGHSIVSCDTTNVKTSDFESDITRYIALG